MEKTTTTMIMTVREKKEATTERASEGGVRRRSSHDGAGPPSSQQRAADHKESFSLDKMKRERDMYTGLLAARGQITDARIEGHSSGGLLVLVRASLALLALGLGIPARLAHHR
jgi:hypothetical protein